MDGKGRALDNIIIEDSDELLNTVIFIRTLSKMAGN